MRPHLQNEYCEEERKPASRISQELDTLRQKIADLRMLESELARAEEALASRGHPGLETRPASHVRREIEARLGYLPAYFNPVLEMPEMLESLWQQSRLGYYDNALPELFKEKLFAQLARYSPSPYSIVLRSCYLRKLGVSPSDLPQLLTEAHAATESDLEGDITTLAAQPSPSEAWPEPNSELECSLLRCSTLLFLRTGRAERAASAIRDFLGPTRFGQLLTFLSFVGGFHSWLEYFPEISYENDPLVREHLIPLLRAEPGLAALFHSYYEDMGRDPLILRAEKERAAAEERSRELFENTIDMIFTLDAGGGLTSLNRAGERITGYSVREASDMKFSDFVAPDCLQTFHEIFQRQISGDRPATFELDILSKSGSRIALEISTRPIFRDGKPFAIQGVARDITQRKRTEEALQLANQKLEAWVSELEQRTHEMTLLSEMGDMLRACLNTDEAYTVIVRVAQQIFPVQAGALYVITPSRNLVEAAVIWGSPSMVERLFSAEECWALRRGRVHWVKDSRTGLLCKHLRTPSPGSYICIPMMAQSEALGVLHLAQPAAMTEAKQRLVITMAEHIAMALSNLKLHETLRSQSIRDPLTGLFNRRFMEESLELELRRATRNQRPLGVIMLDLDHFKHFNDTFGHEAGDTLLRELGTFLQSNIRAEDIACRYGGEEFTLILPEGTAEITMQRANFLLEAVKRMDVSHRSQTLGRITVSMGVATFPEHGRTREALLSAADAALYRSKEEGRDRVTVAR